MPPCLGGPTLAATASVIFITEHLGNTLLAFTSNAVWKSNQKDVVYTDNPDSYRNYRHILKTRIFKT